MSSKLSSFHPTRFLAPHYWPTWVLFGVLWLCTRLPLSVQLSLGRRIGDALYYLHGRRRRIAQINLELCFAQKPATEKHRLLRDAFRSLGMGLLETACLWFRDRQFLLSHVEFDGVEHLHAARKSGTGVILLQAHFTTLELGASLIATKVPMDANYDPPKNPLFAAFLLDRRGRYVENMIGNRSMRQMVRSLRGGGCVWYSPDQHVGQSDGGVMTRFFGREVLTVDGVSRMAKMTGAAVVPFLSVRVEGNTGYRLKVFPPLQDFPGRCSIEDTQRINDLLEAHIREYPEQYFWLHKRFKPTNVDSRDWYL